MGTKEFNWLDKFIARLRLGKVLPYIHENDRILDFGCGHQAFLLSLVRNKVKQGVGIDYDGESRKINNSVEVMNFHFKNMLPFKAKSFDSVFTLAVIEHIDPKDVKVLFGEFNRVLKENGRVILTTPTPLGKKILEFMAYRLGIISRKEVADHKKYYSHNDLKRLAEENGFIMEKYQTFQFGGNSLCVLQK